MMFQKLLIHLNILQVMIVKVDTQFMKLYNNPRLELCYNYVVINVSSKFLLVS